MAQLGEELCGGCGLNIIDIVRKQNAMAQIRLAEHSEGDATLRDAQPRNPRTAKAEPGVSQHREGMGNAELWLGTALRRSAEQCVAFALLGWAFLGTARRRHSTAA